MSLLERGKYISSIILLKILRILDALYVLEAIEVRKEISPLRLAKGEKTHVIDQLLLKELK